MIIISEITTGKIYVGQDRTNSINYFGSASSALRSGEYLGNAASHPRLRDACEELKKTEQKAAPVAKWLLSDNRAHSG
jgi:hypothetical protein